jgi:hypothetical protein
MIEEDGTGLLKTFTKVRPHRSSGLASSSRDGNGRW